MAGYPPQQHYAAHPQPSPYHGGPPGYGMHPGGPPVHHGYAPMPPPGAGPYQSPFGQGGGPSNGPWHDQHYDHHPPPPSGMHGHPHPQSGPLPPPPPPPPALPRHGGYGANVQPGPPPSNGVQQPQQRPPPPHAQPMQHQGQPPPPPPYGAMSAHEFHAGHHPPPHPSRAGPSQQQQPPPPPGNAAGPQRSHQALPAPPSRPSQATKRANASSTRDKDRAGAGAGGTGKAGGQRRNNQDKQGNAKANAAAKAEAATAKAEAARAAAEAADEPIQESKKIRKRKEVVDRIHRVHWDTLENRDLLYNDMQHTLATTGSVLLLTPGLSRPYLLALHRLTLERDAQLRQTALLHAHQVESARTAYEQDRSKVEDEARSAKRAVRERLLAAVEERRKRLREDKEGGEGTSDVLLDSSTRAHATRKLRNKATGSSRRDGGVDMEVVLSSRGKASGAVNGAASGSLGLSLGSGAAGAATGTGSDAEGPTNGKAATSAEGGAFSQPLLSSLMELTGINGGGINGHIAALPPSNFDAQTSGAQTATLLHIGVGGGMGDSSYMASLRATFPSHGKSKKKAQSGKSAAAAAAASSSNAIGHASNNGAVSGTGGTAGGADGALGNAGRDDEDEEGTRSMAAAAAAAVAAATMLNGAGRLRWDQGKSVGQLTSAKDIEIESDLINIRKVGNKRRRR